MGKPAYAKSYRIKRHNPQRQVVKYLVAMLALVLVSFATYKLGYWMGGRDNGLYLNTIMELRDELEFLQEHAVDLQTQVAIHEQSSQINLQSAEAVRDQLMEKEERMLELQDELAFYRSIVSPTSKTAEVAIQRFTLEPADIEGEYRYQLLLVQRNATQTVKGDFTMSISGNLAGRGEQYSLDDLASGDQNGTNFSFKYYQSIEGRLLLPVGFNPDAVVIDVTPKRRGHDLVHQKYNWNTLTNLE